MTYKINPFAPLPEFINVVQQCKGSVIFQTTAGDIMDLNSTLSQFCFAAAASTKDMLREGTLTCTEPDDLALLKKYLTMEA